MAPRPKPRSARAGAATKRGPTKGAQVEAEPRKAGATKAASAPKAEAVAKGKAAAKAAPKAKPASKASAPVKTAKAKAPTAKIAKAPSRKPKLGKVAAKAPTSTKTSETPKTAKTAAAIGKAKDSRTKAASTRKGAAKAKIAAPAKPKRPAKSEAPPYLAVELGTPVDPQGEPIGAGSPRAQSDRDLQEYALQLWRQMQRGSVTKRYMRSMERAGITLDEVWTVGLRETWTTSSTADEMRRYRQRMLFRANLLEAIMSETIADLHRLEGIEPSDAPTTDAPPPAEQSAPRS